MLEFIDSERQHYDDLHEVKEKIYEGLKKQNVSDKKLSQIFGNWTTLCDISLAFNKDLQERRIQIKKNESEFLGDIIIRHLPKCMLYREFCINQEGALSTLLHLCAQRPDIASYLRSCERLMRVQSLPLSSYFLKPMQRITKYKLLIEKLLKNTNAGHPDYTNLEQSLELASTMLVVCNEAVRKRENLVQLQWLQEHVVFATKDEEVSFIGNETQLPLFGFRSLLYSGTLFKVKSKKELVAFLFNDMLFLTQPLNFSASTLPLGNFALPLKPEASLKVMFKAYRKPIPTVNIRIFESASPNQRRRSIWHGRGNVSPKVSSTNLADLETGETNTTATTSAVTTKEARFKRRSISHIRQLSSSLNNLHTDSVDAPISSSFVITDDANKTTQLHVYAPSESFKTTWIKEIQKVALDQQNILNQAKTKTCSHYEESFVAAVDVTVLSASNLSLVGSCGDELPWPYCEVSVCLRSKKTNVILSTRSPKWNCSLRFAVKDLACDIITFTVYSKNASSVEEFIGKAEVEIQKVADQCRLNPDTTWHASFPLVMGVETTASIDATITASFSLTENIRQFDEDDF